MSQVRSVGVVSPGHWFYMATVMCRSLDKIIAKQRVDDDDLPKGVLAGARDFFHSVRMVISGQMGENPPATLNAYVIAADVATPIAQEGHEGLDQRLERFAALVDRLGGRVSLSDDEVVTASDLRSFFARLQHIGDIEEYERQVRFDA